MYCKLFSCARSKLRCSQQVFTDGFSGEQWVKPKLPQKPYNHTEMSEVLKIKVGCFLGKHMHLGLLKQMSLFMRVPLWKENSAFYHASKQKYKHGGKIILRFLRFTWHYSVSVVLFQLSIVITLTSLVSSVYILKYTITTHVSVYGNLLNRIDSIIGCV